MNTHDFSAPLRHISKDGNAYGRPTHYSDDELTKVGPQTPCGEMMRRYWHPVACSKDVGSTPQNVRVLGEDLILFRDGHGRAGLLTPRCIHRGTSLYYGKVEKDGIRCCYHGWQFDVEGRCLDMPCEPAGSTFKERVRQPWYPVEELYGLVFAYMGPPEKKPLLPRWDILENLGPDEKILNIGPSGFGVGGDESARVVPWSWLQDYENTMDPFHVPILHARFTEVHFVPEMAIMPDVTYALTELGLHYSAYRKLEDGRELDRVSPCILPNVRSVPSVTLQSGLSERIGWVVPSDDSSHLLFHAIRVHKDVSDWKTTRSRKWSEMTPEERQKYPGDWEAQEGQGPISLHSEEHLGASDKGIIMLRKLLKKQIELVQQGKDPIGVYFEESKKVLNTGSGNFFR